MAECCKHEHNYSYNIQKSNIQSMTMKNLNSVLDSKNMKLLQETEEEEDEEEYIVSSMACNLWQNVTCDGDSDSVKYENWI